MKDEIRFEQPSPFFVVAFHTTKKLVKIAKEAGLVTNPKDEEEDYELKEGSRIVSP